MRAFEKAAGEIDGEEAGLLNAARLNTFFFVSDYVLVRGVAEALGEADVNEAHRKLLGEMAPTANDLWEFAFGFAVTCHCIFIQRQLES